MYRIFFLLFCFSNTVSAQFQENWLDDEFSTAPVWQGDLQKYVVNTTEHKLKLNAEAVAGEAYIATSSSAINNANWEFSVEMDFNPSGSNYAKIYLVANQATMDDNIEGYYVMVGNTEDEVSLWKRVGGKNSKIIDGVDKILDLSSVSVSVRVTRDDAGNWQLFSKVGSSVYASEGEVFDDEIIESHFFGICCKYTSTRSTKFGFGPITVSGLGYVDKDKPRVVYHELIAGNQFKIRFNESMNAKKLSVDNFSADGISPDRLEVDNPEINIYFDDYLSDTGSGYLDVINVEDEAGNAISDTALVYSFERVKLIATKVISDREVQFSFNKNLDESAINSFVIEGDLPLSNPSLINESALLYASETAMEPDKEYFVELKNVKAAFGDVIKETQVTIVYRKPERFDIVFTELMPDPTPNVGLFETEYIELCNRRDYPINLEGFKIIINDKESVLPFCQLQPNDYVVIVNEIELENWPSQEKLLGVKGLPALTNSSGTLVFCYPDDVVSDVVQYPFNLENSFKNDGGWSYERIDLNNQQPDYNWTFSDHLDGGTPGFENTVVRDNPDVTKPCVRYISYVSPCEYEVIFSESMNITEGELSKLKIDGASISSVNIEPIFLNRINLSLAENLEEKKVYQIKIQEPLKDFAHNELLQNHTVRIGLPEELDSFDICVNEVLFNPASGGVDFVELYNRSDKIINQGDMYLSSMTGGVPDKLMAVCENNQLVFPEDYLVITEDSGILASIYHEINSELVVETDVPSLNDDEGNIAVVKNNGELIDYLGYTDDMHYELLRDKEGVSLERINPDATTNNRHNWHSASKQIGYASPTKQNSQYSNVAIVERDKWLTTNTEEFSPNEDGTDDFVQINYRLNEPGWTGTVSVYNRYGQRIRVVANNELLGTNGFFVWDGTTSNNEKAAMGIYIVYADIFSSEGKTKQEKLTVVLTAGGKK